jgi:hypothetical protein
VLELWNVATGQRIASLPTQISDGTYSLAISPDGKMLAIGGIQGGAEVWSIPSQVKLASIGTPGQQVAAVAFAPDGTTLFVGSGYSIQAISTANFGLIANYTQNFVGQIMTLAVSPDGKKLGYGSRTNAVGVAKNSQFSQAKLSNLTTTPTGITAGASASGTVTLSALALAGGAVIGLQTSNPAVTVPSTVTVPAGSNSATFAVATSSVTSTTKVSVTASYLGASKTVTITVYPQVAFTVTVKPSSVSGGSSTTIAVRLASPAPAGGLKFTLVSSNPAVAALGANTLTIAAGTVMASGPVSTAAVSTTTPVTLSATLGTTTQSTVLTVTH